MQQYIWTILLALGILASSVHAAELRSVESLISQNTRLLVFSPHPDDECLGTGGLIQRVLSAGGKVKVVFMTSGDGYPEGVEMEDHISNPKAEDYRNYGKDREQEALKALISLGMPERDIIFLGFPDGGLSYLFWKYRSDKQSYTSPFTREDRPLPKDIIVPNSKYNDQDLRNEIERVMVDFRPTLVASTPAEDLHPDHCSTYYFVAEALGELKKKDPSIKPRVVTFLIHFGQWPLGQSSGYGSRMNPPKDFADKDAQWMSLRLQPEEASRKREAILQYHTQMIVLGRFLLSFARNNELFISE